MDLNSYLRGEKETHSQLKQDLFVLFHYQDTPGYFVEFGAYDGVETSNTYLLEKKHGWDGLLIEPLPRFRESIINNRGCDFDFRCVHKLNGLTVEFNEVEDMPLVSTLTSHKDTPNMWKDKRQNAKVHLVETVTLDTVLDQHNAPETIDYLSIDTEGSEFMILNAYSFKRNFNLMTVEYSNNEERAKIYNLLSSKDYIRVYPGESKWEDWYAYKPFWDTKNL